MAKSTARLASIRPAGYQATNTVCLRLVDDERIATGDRLAAQNQWGLLRLNTDHPLLLNAKKGDHFIIELIPTDPPAGPGPAAPKLPPRVLGVQHFSAQKEKPADAPAAK